MAYYDDESSVEDEVKSPIRVYLEERVFRLSMSRTNQVRALAAAIGETSKFTIFDIDRMLELLDPLARPKTYCPKKFKYYTRTYLLIRETYREVPIDKRARDIAKPSGSTFVALKRAKRLLKKYQMNCK